MFSPKFPAFGLAGLVLSVFLISAHSQTTISVPGNYTTIQAAINAAPTTGTVIINVGPGVYREHAIDFWGKNITLQSTAGAATTTIDGLGKYTIFQIARGEPVTAQIIGFTIQNGYGRNEVADPWNDRNGQFAGAIGIYAYQPDKTKPPKPTSLTVKNCIFRNNKTILLESRPGEVAPPLAPTATRTRGFGGGAIRISGGGMLQLIGNTFTGNQCSAGGGALEMGLSSAKILNNVFSYNTAGFNGGALRITPPPTGGSLEIGGNTFTNNTARGLADPRAAGTGGAFEISCGSVLPGSLGINFFTLIHDNVFNGNRARFAGGAVSIYGCNTKIYNNTFITNNPDYPNNPDRWYDPAEPFSPKVGCSGGAVHFETHGTDAGGSRIVEITKNSFTSNKVRNGGGAINIFLMNTVSKITVSGNTFDANIAEYPGRTYSSLSAIDPYGTAKMGQGGAINIGSTQKNSSGAYLGPGTSTITVTSNQMRNNRAQDFAAGLLSGGNQVFQRNAVENNVGIFRHGGIVMQLAGGVNVSDNTFRSNKVEDANQFGSGDGAGGIMLASIAATSPIVANNRFEYNRGRYGAVYWVKSAGALALTNNRFYRNTATLTDSGGRIISGSFSANNSGVTPTGMAITATLNSFTADSIGMMFTSYASSKLRINSNNFTGNTRAVARGTVDGLTRDYLTVADLNATAFADSNTANP